MMSQVCHWLTNRVWMNMSTSSGIGAGRISLRVACEACRCPLRDGPPGLFRSHHAHRARHPRDEPLEAVIMRHPQSGADAIAHLAREGAVGDVVGEQAEHCGRRLDRDLEILG